jgi:hypothetical protein
MGQNPAPSGYYVEQRLNPKLSAATHIFGQHDYNRAPMAPQGQELLLMKNREGDKLGLHMDKMDGI